MQEVFNELLAKLRTISALPYYNIWNNQFLQIKEGKEYQFPLPACFLEIENTIEHKQLIQQSTSSQLNINFHLLFDFYDAGNNDFEKNLSVYTLRDNLILNLISFVVSGCSPLQLISEQQDYDHDNLTHYIFTMQCEYIENTFNRYNRLIPFYARDEQTTKI